MYIRKGKEIITSEGYKTRWRVVDSYSDEAFVRYKLIDTSDDIKPPLKRELFGACLNFSHRKEKVDKWLVESDRKQFIDACKAISSNFAGFPVLIDFFYIKNKALKRILPKFSEKEPFVVFHYGAGYIGPRLKPDYVAQCSWAWPSLLFKYLKAVGYLLRVLHRPSKEGNSSKIKILRQCPPDSLVNLYSNKMYMFKDFFSIAEEGESQFAPNIPFIRLKKVFSAPECFDQNGQLTPATDVYALAKSFLLYLGVCININHPFPDQMQVEKIILDIEKRFSKKLPNSIKRWLKIALQKAPGCRHLNIIEALSFLRKNSR